MNPLQTLFISSSLIAMAPTGVMALSPCGSAAEEEVFEAQLKFETKEIKLGEIQTSEAERSFTFTGINTGNAPLVLTYVHPSCNCVHLQYPREPIAASDTLRIRGVLNPHGLSAGPFRRDIMVRSNALDSKIRLLITGTVVTDSIR